VTAPVSAIGYHIGFVVEDSAATAREYQALLGGTYELFESTKPPPGPLAPELEPSRLGICYGRFGGMTMEFIQVIEGRGIHARFLEEHGPGAHHVGFWVPDLAEALVTALDHGARLTSAAFSGDGLGTVSLAAATPADLARAVSGTLHFATLTNTIELELLGPTAVEALSTILGHRTDAILDLPPWVDAATATT
jgi:hypothetical protein